LHSYFLADCGILQNLLRDLGFSIIIDELKFIKLILAKKDYKDNIKRDTINFSKLFILTNNYNCFIENLLYLRLCLK
jgi:hypothetical protein